MSVLESWRLRARTLKRDTYALYLAARDPRTPWYARGLAVLIVAYAFSPIDLIPDFIPVLGYLDDLLLVPLGVALLVRLVPTDVMADARARASVELAGNRPKSYVAAGVIALIWILLAAVACVWLWKVLIG
ncbi:MAG TPA: YkvA family protein [Chloroflexota bacterium]|nr:YkvA family protein [Chloroflexota bacterium]